MKTIPVVDVFAGPGGLGEGFSSVLRGEKPLFKLVLSVEKDPAAHATLLLRAFVREFHRGKLPLDYYRHLEGRITRQELYTAWPKQYRAALTEVLEKPRELGNRQDNLDIDAAIENRTVKSEPWILIGGPPCQAYSLAGRSRRAREDRAVFESDARHFLYREYLRLIKTHQPDIFVMENVKGLLSATVQNRKVLELIVTDMQRAGYELHPLGYIPENAEKDKSLSPGDFLLRAEDYGIPQTRHRLIIVGVRRDIGKVPQRLDPEPAPTVDRVIGDLPPIRSLISSKGRKKSNVHQDSIESWFRLVEKSVGETLPAHNRSIPAIGVPYLKWRSWATGSQKLKIWCRDNEMRGVINHNSRSHIPDDIRRYVFCAIFGQAHGRPPKLRDFPKDLLPQHRNISGDLAKVPHNDRFKVQLAEYPASTITSHISKDGHHFIHYDPWQARSLSVREAARIQTFPDNYLFTGSITEQYTQVGNAVPPYLARKIAECILSVLHK